MIQYVYRMKRLIRNKTLFFWLMIFPIVLATFFKLAFSSITEKDWGFETIPVAVVGAEGAGADQALVSFLEEMKNEEEAFFAVTETSRAEAEELLKKNEVTAVIVTGDAPELLVTGSGLSATVVKTVYDGYLQSVDLFLEAAMQGKLAEVTEVFSAEVQTVVAREFPGASKDPLIQYFQALLAMASLYGAMYGLVNTQELTPSFSDVAARRVSAPMKKIPTVLSDVAAAFTMQYVQFIILIIYICFILRVDFGRVTGWLFLAGAFHSLLGVVFGYFVGAAVRKNESVQESVLMSFTMISSFLAGLMVGNIRVIIEEAAPIVNRINPATLIAESLQALCVMGDRKKFAQCLLGISIWCAVFIVGSIIAIGLYQRAARKEAAKV